MTGQSYDCIVEGATLTAEAAAQPIQAKLVAD
jgi:hypothetical protein